MVKKATKVAEEAVEQSAEAVRETLDKASKGMESFATLHKEAIEALVESAGVAAKGAEKVQASFAAYAKSAAEEFSTAAKAIMGSGSWQAAMELQGDYLKSSFEAYFAEATKVKDLMTAITKEAFEPIQKQTQVFVDKLKLAA